MIPNDSKVARIKCDVLLRSRYVVTQSRSTGWECEPSYSHIKVACQVA